jgi:hypothetical protein
MEDEKEQPTKEEPQTSAELPRWKCHKEVWAFKITAIQLDSDLAKVQQNRETDGSALLYHNESYFLPVRVDAAYLKQHKPQVGGYYVQYKDGYKSYSPAQAFEEGYSRIK